MGYTEYNIKSRSLRAETMNYSAVTSDVRAANAVFKQNVEQKIHDLMSPKGLLFRECFDSDVHPNTVPIVVALDVTGSMGGVPKELCAEGLPTMMSTIIQRGIPDASVCFVCIGDHVYDRAPLQVGQFESGDAELDMWLTRSWLEGRGGGNDGESYGLAWYFAAKHTKLHCCEKRGKKAFLFTIGDEPILPEYPVSAIKAIFGEQESIQSTVKAEEILKEAQQCYNVFHLAIGHRGESYWKELLGQNYIPLKDYHDVAKVIAETTHEWYAKDIKTETPGVDIVEGQPKITL